MSETREVGTIGQMYEHRKNGKVGVLESRDDKFKTLMFRDKEGKSFNVTYATFHSAWRKYAGDEVIETSTQKEEKKSQKKEQIDEVKKVIDTPSEAKKLSRSEMLAAVIATKEMLEDKIVELEGKFNLKVRQTYKGGIKLYVKRKIVAEFWILPKNNQFDLYQNQMLRDMFSLADRADLTKEHPDWEMCIQYTFDRADMSDIMDVVLKNVVDSGIANKGKDTNDDANDDENETEEE